MGYRNKTYIIFDGDEDSNYYYLMTGWKGNKNIEFDFNNAHDLVDIQSSSVEETVKKTLRERFNNSKQVIVLIGEKTKNLYQYVRWEIEVAQELDLPIIAVNLNGSRSFNSILCPAILRDGNAIHVSFEAHIIKYALDYFPDWYYNERNKNINDNYHYPKSVYDSLGI